MCYPISQAGHNSPWNARVTFSKILWQLFTCFANYFEISYYSVDCPCIPYKCLKKIVTDVYPVILFIASRMSTRSTAELLLDMDKVLFNTFFEQEILSDHFWSEQINSHTQQIFELISELYKCKSPYWFLKLDQQIHVACCLLVPSCIGSENCKTPYSVFCFQ